MSKLVIILLFCLSSCGLITSDVGGHSSPQPEAPFSKTMRLPAFTDKKEMQPVSGSPFYIYAAEGEWSKVATFKEVYSPFKIAFTPGSAQPSDVNPNRAQGVAQNNIVSLCYNYQSQTSALSSLFGSNDGLNCSNLGENPVTGSADCYAGLGIKGSAKSQGKLYTAFLTANDRDNISPKTISGSCAPQQQSFLRFDQTYCLGNPNCNNSCGIPAGSCGDSPGPYAGPYMLDISKTNSDGDIIPPAMCPCSSAYDGGGLSQDFVGKCIFYNGMGVTIGYGNTKDGSESAGGLGSIWTGSQSFQNKIDPINVIFQSSDIFNLPKCSGQECDLIVSFAGSGSNLAQQGDTVASMGSSYQPYKDKPKENQVNKYYSLGNSHYYLIPRPKKMWNPTQTDNTLQNSYLFVETSGCYAIGGQPVGNNTSNYNGVLEYLIVNKGKVVRGSTPRTGMVTGQSENSAFINMLSSTGGSDSDLYLRIRDDGSRSDNSGYYQISVYSYPKDGMDFLATTIASVLEPVKEQIFAISQQMFSNIISTENFKRIINAMLILYITGFGFSFLMGNTDITQKDLVARLAKIGVILTFMNSNNAQAFFNEYLLNLFWNGTINLISYVTDTQPIQNQSTGEYILDYRGLFGDITSVIEYFFSRSFLQILFILVLWFPMGVVVIGFFIKNIFTYLNAIVVAMVAWLMAMTALGLFIGLAPLFIILVLFKQTRETFNNWLKVMTSFAFQPIIMFAGITVITKLILGLVYQIASTTINLHPVFTIYVPFADTKISLLTFYWWFPSIGLVSLMALVFTLDILAEMLKSMPSFAGEIARNLFDTGAGASAGKIDDVAKGTVDDLKKPVGMDKATQAKIKSGDSGGAGAGQEDAQAEGQNRAKLK
ncbi:MAG: type IV secretion system protein [Rickettsiales bacterium]